MGHNTIDELTDSEHNAIRRGSTATGERPKLEMPSDQPPETGTRRADSGFEELRQKLQDVKTSKQPYPRGTDGRKRVTIAPAAAAARSSAAAAHARNYDEAPPGQPGPDLSAKAAAAAKPQFTRGLSAIDNTAITSAGPTPAFEKPNPMARVGSKPRESHLPDLDIRDADVPEEEYDEMDEDPEDEWNSGRDAFAPSMSRRELETGTGDPSGWEVSEAQG